MISWPGENRRPGYTFEAHAFAQLKAGKRQLPWQWCPRCGLILFRNAATEWCREKGCNYDEHPAYRATMRRLLGAA